MRSVEPLPTSAFWRRMLERVTFRIEVYGLECGAPYHLMMVCESDEPGHRHWPVNDLNDELPPTKGEG